MRLWSRRLARAADEVIPWSVGGFLALVALGERSEHSGFAIEPFAAGAALLRRRDLN